LKTESNELYKKYRPSTLSEVVGNSSVIGVLSGFFEKENVPQFLMFTGPSGCGKTTLARVVKDALGCKGTDYQEIDASSDNGINMVRKIRPVASSLPLHGESRVFIIDEAHEMTKQAQNAALKLLEDTPKQTYVIFCTTDPSKLLKTVKTRATELKVAPLSSKELQGLLLDISKKEDIKLSKELGKKILEHSDGSPRQALVHLNAVRYVEDSKDQIAMITGEVKGTNTYDLCKLICKKNVTWPEICKALKLFQGDPEGCRLAVLGYCKSILLNGSTWVVPIMEEFEENLYANKFSGLCLQFYRAWASKN
jgi:DNA polymerase-3 subunit gamma/tau